MKTYSQKASEVLRDWYVVDATDQTLGPFVKVSGPEALARSHTLAV